MSIGVYVCMHGIACMYVCMHVCCMYVWTDGWMCVCMYACMYVGMCVCCICMYVGSDKYLVPSKAHCTHRVSSYTMYTLC